METYHGHVRTPADAIVLFEACRIGQLPRVQRRLSEKERQNITSGSVFVWDEREAGMRRWTDGKSWSASRVSGSFLTYREMEGKRGNNNAFAPPVPMSGSRAGRSPNMDGSDSDGVGSDGPDGYRYKPDGLMKQSFSITTATNHKLHLISYYARSHPSSPTLMQPTQDPNLKHIRPEKGMYPESTLHESASNGPGVTRGAPLPPYGQSTAPAYARQLQATHPHSYQVQPQYWPASTLPPSPHAQVPQYVAQPHIISPAPPMGATLTPTMTYGVPALPTTSSSGHSSPRSYNRPTLPQLEGLPQHRGSIGSSINRPVSGNGMQGVSPPASLPSPRPSITENGTQSTSTGTPDQTGPNEWLVSPLNEDSSMTDNMDPRLREVQDIPSDKLDFAEDTRALRALDKKFVL